jgi:hypothetical protein
MEGPLIWVTSPTFSLKKMIAGTQVAMTKRVPLNCLMNLPDVVFRRNTEKSLSDMVAKGRMSLFGYVWKFEEVAWIPQSQPCASLAAMRGLNHFKTILFSTFIDKK